jgi:hypothetical protein
MPNTEASLVNAFLEALNGLPGADARLEQRLEPDLDALVAVDIGGRRVLLLVEAKRSAYPRDVREAAWRLRNYRSHAASRDAREATPVVIAEAMSPGAREWLREEGIGYFDMGGSLFLPAREAFVFVDKPPPKNAAKRLAAVFQGRRAIVTRLVFTLRSEWLTVKEIAERGQVSPATVSETLTELERRDWMVAQGNGPAKVRKLIEPEALVEAWTREALAAKPRKLHRYYVPNVDVGELVYALANGFNRRHAPYAVTGEAAAQAYTPFLTSISQVRCRALADSVRHDVLAELEARPVSEGWNLGLIDSPSRSDFADNEEINGVMFASPLQTYLDLLHAGGRARDLAEHLHSERLR